MRQNRLTFIAIFSVLASVCFATPKKSLYERAGGIHKIAAAVDMCVEQESMDPVLNENPRFKMVMQVGKPVLKFVITNIISAASGGPQKVGIDLIGVDKWLNQTKAQSDRAWSIRAMCFEKAGIGKTEFMEIRNWLKAAEKAAQPITPGPEVFKDKGSLYARLGGIVAISAVVDDFVDMLAADPTIGSNPNVVNSLKTGKITGAGLKYLVTEQLAQAAGGPYVYSGRTMKEAHKDLAISEKEWQAGAGILKKVLDKYNVPSREQGEIFQAITASHDDIVKH